MEATCVGCAGSYANVGDMGPDLALSTLASDAAPPVAPIRQPAAVLARAHLVLAAARTWRGAS